MNNLRNVNAQFPLGVMTAVTGVSGSGKTTLVCKVLADTIATKLGMSEEETSEESGADSDGDEAVVFEQRGLLAGAEGLELIDRLVIVDQKPIGRTPRSNLATYTGLFDTVRQRFAATDEAKKRGFNAGKFSFNVDGGRCPNCEGEGFVSVELLFLPRVYAPCTVCHGARYKSETLEILYEGKNIAQVLEMTVDAASDFFSKLPAVARTLKTLREVGLGYLRIGQPATELSGGEAQRIKLAAELQRAQRGHTLYVLDEPTTGLHPADVEKLISQLHGLVDAGNTVIVVEHDMDVISSADWIIDLGPGGGNRGGQIVATGTPLEVSKSVESRTAPYLAESLALKRPAKKTD